MGYVKTNDIERATHWVGTYDKNFVKPKDVKTYLYQLLSKFSKKYLYIYQLVNLYNNDTITLGQPYPLFKSSDDDEIVIIDDLEREGNLWRIHKGYFLQEVDT